MTPGTVWGALEDAQLARLVRDEVRFYAVFMMFLCSFYIFALFFMLFLHCFYAVLMLKMMSFQGMGDWVGKATRFSTGIKNDEFCMKTDEFCFLNMMNFALIAAGRSASAIRMRWAKLEVRKTNYVSQKRTIRTRSSCTFLTRFKTNYRRRPRRAR